MIIEFTCGIGIYFIYKKNCTFIYLPKMLKWPGWKMPFSILKNPFKFDWVCLSITFMLRLCLKLSHSHLAHMIFYLLCYQLFAFQNTKISVRFYLDAHKIKQRHRFLKREQIIRHNFTLLGINLFYNRTTSDRPIILYGVRFDYRRYHYAKFHQNSRRVNLRVPLLTLLCFSFCRTQQRVYCAKIQYSS